MTKYDFVLFAAQSDDFIERLRELGLVDVTTTGWEPSEEDRQLLSDIEGTTKAVDFLASFTKDASRCDASAAPYATGKEAYAAFVTAQQQSSALNAEAGRLEKVADELRPWGEFDVRSLEAMAAEGVTMRYFIAQRATYEKMQTEWSAAATLAEINATDSLVWFVAIVEPGTELYFDAQEMKMPTMDIREAERLAAENAAALKALDATYSRVAATEASLRAYNAELQERLQSVRVEATAETAADGALMLLEGWAESETAAKVDALLEEYPNVVYLKRDPTPEDDTPVKLKNGWYSRIFEMVGDMYARPKYGTLDLTPFFAPFYMLFFGICLNDAGYGLILLLAGIAMLMKFREPGMMRRASWFATMCALSTTLFGLFCGSFFGLSLGDYLPVTFFDFQGQFFNIALAIGIVQILFGLALNVYTISKTLGFKYSLGTLGWLLILLGGVIAGGLPMFGVELPFFTTSSPAFYAVEGLGAVLLLLLNTPGRNIFINFGSGLWTLYNNVTGLLSDVLSYIRLFAIGLSGGVLAVVFNSLAAGFVPEGAGIVTRLLVMIPILLIGHGINLFMSTISSFVHPMRLTFVEFFKNAGFEMASRNFEPLQKVNQQK